MKKSQALVSLGALLVALISLTALLAPWLAPYDPLAISLPDQLQAPTWAHPFGRDQNGSDVLSKVIYGARVSITVAFSVVAISVSIGLLIGSIAGYLGGWVDGLIMRIIDMLYAFPGFLLALSLVAVLGPSLRNLIFAMCITSWTSYARLVRGEVLHLKEKDYVVGAEALGAKTWRILTFHIWPNLVGPLTVQATFGMAGTIISESGLSFLGLGAPPEIPTWGALLNAGRRSLIEAPHISLFPGIAILCLVLGFNFLGDGLRDKLDPRQS